MDGTLVHNDKLDEQFLDMVSKSTCINISLQDIH